MLATCARARSLVTGTAAHCPDGFLDAEGPIAAALRVAVCAVATAAGDTGEAWLQRRGKAAHCAGVLAAQVMLPRAGAGPASARSSCIGG